MSDSGHPKFRNDRGVPEICIGVREFECIGVSPPQDHPHIYIDMGGADTILCPYCGRAIRYGDGWIPGGDIREVLPKFRDMARDAGRDPASIEITSFALGEDLDRGKGLNEMGVTRVVPMFPPDKADKVLPIVDRSTKVMRQVNG